jgi:hypothetical protein
MVDSTLLTFDNPQAGAWYVGRAPAAAERGRSSPSRIRSAFSGVLQEFSALHLSGEDLYLDAGKAITEIMVERSVTEETPLLAASRVSAARA